MTTTIINPAEVFYPSPVSATPTKIGVLKAWFMRAYGTAKRFATKVFHSIVGWFRTGWGWLTARIPAGLITGMGYLALATKAGWNAAGKVLSKGLGFLGRILVSGAKLVHRAIDRIGDGITWLVGKFSKNAAVKVGDFFAAFGEKRIDLGTWIATHTAAAYHWVAEKLNHRTVRLAVGIVAGFLGGMQILHALSGMFGWGGTLVAKIAMTPVLSTMATFATSGGWMVPLALAAAAVGAAVISELYRHFGSSKAVDGVETTVIEGKVVQVVDDEALVSVGAPTQAEAKAQADKQMADVKAIHGSNPQKRHPKRK